MEVSLDDKVVIRVDIIKGSSQENASALATGLWFYYESFILLLVTELASKVGVVRGQEESHGEKVIVIWETLGHPT